MFNVMMNRTGKFENVSVAVFEGPDCCGKSTQVDAFINEAVRDQSFDVIFKVHFPFNSMGDDKLKNNYDNLVKTIYSDDYLENITQSDILKINDVVLYNININNLDKMVFLNTMSSIIKGHHDIDTELTYENRSLSMKNLIMNKNCDIWFNGKKLYKQDEEIKMLHEYFKMTPSPKVLLVFDRFIISGIIYNYYLPYSILKNKILDDNIGKYDDKLKKHIKVILETAYIYQSRNTTAEIDEMNYITSNILNFEEKCFVENYNYCNLKIQWFIFKPSEEIYKAFLNDKSRKIDDYDSNNVLRSTVNEHYKMLIDDSDKKPTLFVENKFNITCIDSDKYIGIYGDKSKEAITSDIFAKFKNNIKVYQNLEEQIYNFYLDMFEKIK